MLTLGIPAEHKNLFERRTAVVPVVAARLVNAGATVLVERSKQRAFTERQYMNNGARIVDDLGEAQVIAGVKEPPVKSVTDKIYMIFSHTIKGQTYNMPLLQRFLDAGATLIDYELITDARGHRLVAFGRFAGIAGMNDTLWTLGLKLHAMGIDTPLDLFRPANSYRDLTDLFGRLNKLKQRIEQEGLPLSPLVVGITGYGRVARGSTEVLTALGGIQVKPEELDSLSGPGIFYVMFEERHMFARRDGGFDLQEYYDHPELYHSVFEQYLPKLHILMNSIYWEPRYPRLLTRDFIGQVWGTPDFKLLVIGDTTCDPQGACEITDHCTGPGNPSFTYLPLDDAFAQAVVGDGITVFAVENLPAELPVDASTAFSLALEPYVTAAIRADFNRPLNDLVLPAELKRAIIVLNGELTPDFRYLERFLNAASH